MEIYNKFKESESIVIEGDKKIGKMSLAIFLSYQFQNQFTFLSPLSTNKIDRKIESFQKILVILKI